jgi:four helix bundle protein
METPNPNPKLNNSQPKPRPELRHRAYKFAVLIVKLVDDLAKQRFSRPVLDQLSRAGPSVGANVVEAKSAISSKEFAHFYQIAMKSANETMFWLCLVRDGLGVDRATVKALLDEAKELAHTLGASVITSRRTD